MPKLLDLFKFNDKSAPRQRRFFGGGADLKLRREERDAAILAGNYPPDGADIESISEYRLASLMQYPHY
ncbi:MAG TPA: hypothetical protein VFE64_11740 [Devosia sp.]|jgi:hypothetical protein|nr:hypothetical protein [Devosia sp.]